jgi:hypothetical protein
LVSRFALDTDLKDAFKKSKISVLDYREAVENYRNATDKTQKRQLVSLIADIKSKFRIDLQTNDPNHEKLKTTQDKLRTIEGQDALFEESAEDKKETRKNKAALKASIAQYESALEDIKNNNIYKDAFEWRLEFPEVLDKAGNYIGFDVVIGNPPYFSISRLKESGVYFQNEYQVYSKGTDVYALFYERGNKILRNNGLLTYITSNSWLRAIYGDLLKAYFQKNMQALNLLNIEDTQIFDEATVESNIISLQKRKWRDVFSVCTLGSDYSPASSLEDYFSQHHFEVNPEDNEWTVSNSTDKALKEKITNGAKLLKEFDVTINFGIKTGYNAAFILDATSRAKLIAKDAACSSIIKPILRGRDLKKYSFEFSNKWVICTFPSLKLDIKKYPSILSHFNSIGKQRLEQSGAENSRKKTNNKWFETQDTIGYWDDFNKPKIVWGEISDKPKFSYDDHHYYAEATTFLMTGEKLKYLLAILNSKVSEWYFNQISTTTGMGTNRWKKYKIEMLPIAVANKKQEQGLTVKVNAILKAKAKGADTSNLEREIDDMVYKLYGLTYDEVKTIEPEYNSMSQAEYEALV